ncbi:MAG: LysM peptidoglycan-binding domain-containing protein [Candidatus Dormibacteraeota bacterium]|nr:LysM peptidoglycan-binding domain-containing protein [Candidatus Dormibacteraeota bacterium]
METSVRCSGRMYDVSVPNRFHRSRRGRRPRILAAALSVAAVALLLIGGVAYGGASSGPQHVTVHAGDTLWGIAASHYPGGDVQSRVQDIEAANHLTGAAISPGEILTLPAP